ncbi:DegT/DnrJ/EryC1/StrS aminotransferase family protein [Methanobacterium formicicum]|uniref:Protein ArnB n=1 Tax=Methanobacterium formicicum (strain DSM 3637 / PP1) TaxID=1204725 RepID=K2RCK5_METFP|nr:DegT/DnrJ/EryC1/StrS family aminotransferase [Methanobacterium formicicum]EKF86039.1 protein ArnB [Methanobacterium formicicum DSM 3637]
MDQIPYGMQCITDDDIKEVVTVLKSNWITTGPKVEEFEKSLCKYIGCNFATAVNSGTSALDIAVQTLNLEKGSEVITTPFTFAATANSIIYNNLTPVFADIEKETRNINPNELMEKITEKTKAIIYVDYAGQPCDINEIKKIANENGLFLIEDACHALGSKYYGKNVGNFADMTIFSFHPVKHITTGEGGAVITNNSEFDRELKILRNHGIDKDLHKRQAKMDYAYDIRRLGRNYRITDFQSALGISQLKKLDGFLNKRLKLVELYSKRLSEVDFLELPTAKSSVKHAWHIYTILLDKQIDRDEFF